MEILYTLGLAVVVIGLIVVAVVFIGREPDNDDEEWRDW